jgi:hypothetical protein
MSDSNNVRKRSISKCDTRATRSPEWRSGLSRRPLTGQCDGTFHNGCATRFRHDAVAANQLCATCRSVVDVNVCVLTTSVSTNPAIGSIELDDQWRIGRPKVAANANPISNPALKATAGYCLLQKLLERVSIAVRVRKRDPE